MTQLRGAARLAQHAEEVRVGDAFTSYVCEQVGIVRRLAQDDLCVVRVEVHLKKGATNRTFREVGPKSGRFLI